MFGFLGSFLGKIDHSRPSKIQEYKIQNNNPESINTIKQKEEYRVPYSAKKSR
jgi:hypothetical protein